MCPYCRTNAPLVYRGIQASCAGCGRARTVFSGSSLTHAGQPSKVGGSLVTAFSRVLLGVGLLGATAIGLLLSLFSITSGLIVAGVLALFTIVTFLLLRGGGKKLTADGEAAQGKRREQALFALAQNRGGVLQAVEAARALDLSEGDADDFLTRMAKQRPDVVNVDISERGEVLYTFLKIAPAGGALSDAGSWSGPRVRVGGSAEVASAPRPQPPLDPRVIDAEFQAIEEAAPAQKRRHS